MVQFSNFDPRAATIKDLLDTYGEAYYWEVEACSEEQEMRCAEVMESITVEILRRCGQ